MRWWNDAFYIRHHRQANCWFSNLECRRPYALIKLVTAFPWEHLLLLDENRMIIPSRNWMFILLARNTHSPVEGRICFYLSEITWAVDSYACPFGYAPRCEQKQKIRYDYCPNVFTINIRQRQHRRQRRRRRCRNWWWKKEKWNRETQVNTCI